MFLTLVFAALLQTPFVPPGWTASNNQTPLEASGPSQAVKIPVALWDADANPAAPDVSFSYSITASDKDTFFRVVNPNANPPTTETQQFPQGVDLNDLDIRYPVVGGTSGYANGVHTWTFTGQGITVLPKPKLPGEYESTTVEA
jgi:hypothetical protein